MSIEPEEPIDIGPRERIVIPMGNKLEALGRNRRIRTLGTVAGLVPGALALLSPASVDPFSRALATAALVLGAALGWAFAVRAGSPGWRNGLQTALGIAICAVPLGSFLVAAVGIAAVNGNPDPGLPDVLLAGVLGLVFLGIPMLLVTFIVAITWVGGVKLCVRLGFVGLTASVANAS